MFGLYGMSKAATYSTDCERVVFAILTVVHKGAAYSNIRKGRYIFTLEGKVMILSASDPQSIRVPPAARHTSRVDDTHEGPCAIEISGKASPNSPSSELETYGTN